jgi:hypothetical protein
LRDEPRLAALSFGSGAERKRLGALSRHDSYRRSRRQPDLGKTVDRDGKPKINEVTKGHEDPLGWTSA